MRITLGKPELTCVALEKELGLARGEIREMKIETDGTFEIEIAKSLSLAQKTKLESITGLKIKEIKL